MSFRPFSIGIMALAFLGAAAFGCTSTPAATSTPSSAASDSATTSAPIPAGFAHPELLVDTAWLAAHATDSDVRVLDVRAVKDYDASHIPGAVNLPNNELVTTSDGLKNMAPSAERFAETMAIVGVTPDTRVVIVDAGDMLWASRLLWTMERFGHKSVSVLHGGVAAWLADERPTTTVAVKATRTSYVTNPQGDLVWDYNQMTQRLGDPAFQPVDNRSPQEYTGEDVRSQNGGHIPGAINVDWTQHLVQEAVPVLKTPDQLEALYAAAGLARDKEIATYCQTGIRASHGYLVLRLLGYDQVAVYDGSWLEWGNRTGAPIQR